MAEIAPGRAALTEGSAAREAGAVPGPTAALASVAEVTVICVGCRGLTRGELGDDVDATGSVSLVCWRCAARFNRRVWRRDAARWAARAT